MNIFVIQDLIFSENAINDMGERRGLDAYDNSYMCYLTIHSQNVLF